MLNILLVIVIKDLSVGLQYNICTGQILSLELLLNTTKYFLLANAIALFFYVASRSLHASRDTVAPAPARSRTLAAHAP